jgi:hypothetical protein
MANVGKKNSNVEHDTIGVKSAETTRFICKVCGDTFGNRDILNRHLAELHHPKRTVVISDIINAFEGQINFPKTKAEIVRYVEENKEDVTPEVIDVLKNIPDRQYNNESDLMYGIEQGRR